MKKEEEKQNITSLPLQRIALEIAYQASVFFRLLFHPCDEMDVIHESLHYKTIKLASLSGLTKLLVSFPSSFLHEFLNSP